MGNVTTWRHWTTMWQKTQVHGNLTCRSETQFHYSFYARADTSPLAEYCVHVPLILHGHILGARIQCATVVGWPKEGGAKAINNWLGVVSSLNGSYIYCTYWTEEAKLAWLFWLSLQNPFGSIYFTTVNLGGKGKISSRSAETTVLKTMYFG